MTSDRRPLIGADGEVREITAEDLRHARRGRPPLPEGAKKRRTQLMLDPEVIVALKRDGGSMSARVNRILREALGLDRKKSA
ncbi:BrnA antitoxin family protein [Oceanithermus sp.]|uniref:BrnA antitoxin family protein n=1 Tax=Oceanithermus sp. TaxID=2268145 RepID=UPI00257DB5BE|nr:BrnA antitoxin family protein [Oceanithermus sp.]